MTAEAHARADGVVAALRELIDAVDRRVPQLEGACEPRIASLAAVLRAEAASRLAALVRADGGRDGHDTALVDAVMTDDGGPTAVDPLSRASAALA